MSSDPLTILQNQWYNTIAAGVGGNANFQIIQPTTTLPATATNDQLWALFNNIPPQSLTSNLTLSGGNQFYSDYSAVLSGLSSNALTNFQNVLGSYYPLWQQYLSGLSTSSWTLQTLPSVFYQWAVVNAPSVAGPGRSAYQGMLLDPISQAQTMALNTSGFVNNTPNFTQGLTQLFQQVPAGSSLNLSFDSSTASSNVTSTWAQGNQGALFGIFGSSDSSTSQLTQIFASSRVTASVSFQKAITFVTDPPGPPNGWYSSAALSAAYNSSGNAPWNPNASQTWNGTFGPTGNMQRFVGSLIVVDNMAVTVTSDAEYDSSQQTAINQRKSSGFWPFYWSSGSAGYNNNVSFNSNSNLTYTMTSDPGAPQIIGANVLPVSQYLGGNAHLAAFVMPRR